MDGPALCLSICDTGFLTGGLIMRDKNATLIREAQAILTDHLTRLIPDEEALSRLHRVFQDQRPTHDKKGAMIRDAQSVLLQRRSKEIADNEALNRLHRLFGGSMRLESVSNLTI